MSGPGAQATATTLTFPETVRGPVQLACERDCLYLVTLDDASGRPMVATRGALTGGASATAISLPAAKLPAGSYRFDVRLVSKTNPGTITRTLSSPLAG